MLLREALLSPAEAEEFRGRISQLCEFQSGKRTATGAARAVKENLEASAAEADQLTSKLRDIVRSSDQISDFTFLKDIPDLILSRYDTGMFYGSHIDGPVMHGKRVDFSFTLFLSDPDSYRGGALVLEGERPLCLREPAGTIVVYPTALRHRVEAVESGSRLVAVGWITSHIASPPLRPILRSLKALSDQLLQEESHDRHMVVLAIYAEIYRLNAS